MTLSVVIAFSQATTATPAVTAPAKGSTEMVRSRALGTVLLSPFPYFFLNVWAIGSRALTKACPSPLWVPRAREASTRITVAGAIYLAAVCILPEILISQYAVPFYFGGTSLLIVVNVTMDTVSQIQSHLIAHQYGDLIKKAKLKGGRRR